MTSLLVLLALLSVASLAARRGAMDALVNSAATPLLVGLGVLLSPRLLGVLTPSVLDGLGPAVDVGATTLGFFVGVRANSSSLIVAGARPVAVGALAVLAACGVAAAVLLAVGPLASIFGADGAIPAARHVIADALLVGACLAGLPAEADSVTERVRAWAHVTECAAGLAAVGAVLLSAQDGLAAVAATCAIAACGALVLWLLPKADGVARTIALLGVLIVLAGLARLSAVPPALCAFVVGLVVGRSRDGAPTLELARAIERPVRVVVTVVIASILHIGVGDLVLGLALAVGQLLVQIASARGLQLSRSQLGAALASSTTPIAFVAAWLGASRLADQLPLLPAIVVAVAVSDFLSVAVVVADKKVAERA